MELSQEVSHHFATIGTGLASEIPESGSVSYHNHLMDTNKKFDFRLCNNKRLRRNPLENRVIVLTSGQKSHYALRAKL